MTTAEVSEHRGADQRWEHPVRLTALYDEHLSRGASLEERDGWLVPRSYGDLAAELTALRTSVGLLDIGDNGKIDVKGNELDAVLASVSLDAGGVDVGSSSVVSECERLCRLARDQALLITAPHALQATVDRIDRAASDQACVHVTNLTGAWCGVRLLGPRAPAVLERLSSLDLAPDRFEDGALAQGPVAKIRALIVRCDAAGLPGYDVYVDRDLGSYLWDAMLEAGAPLGLRPAGRAAAEELE